MTNPPEIQIYPSKTALAKAAAELIANSAIATINEAGIFRLVLAGGSTPEKSYRHLASPELSTKIDWQHVQLFWGDERIVPPGDADSNYRMAKENLLDHIPIPQGNIFRMKGELAPEKAAVDYEAAIRHAFEGKPARFDLILLGLGEDGHTASLFPGSEALTHSSKYVAANYVNAQSNWRLTMTYPVINKAHSTAFLVSGVNKAKIVSTLLEGQNVEPTAYPAAGIALEDGELYWLLDADAASGLNDSK